MLSEHWWCANAGGGRIYLCLVHRVELSRSSRTWEAKAARRSVRWALVGLLWDDRWSRGEMWDDGLVKT